MATGGLHTNTALGFIVFGHATGEFVHEQFFFLAIWGHKGMRTREFVHNTSVTFEVALCF